MLGAMDDFFDLDLAGRLAWARGRLAPLAARLGGELTLEDTSGPATVEGAQDDGLFVMIRTRVPGSGRAVSLFGYVLDLNHYVGAYGIGPTSGVCLAVEVDNRLGWLDLVYDPREDDDEPIPETHELFGGTLYVSSIHASERAQMKQLLGRLPSLADSIEPFLRKYDGYALRIHHTVEVSIAYLDDDDDEWAANTADLDGRIAALEAIAAMIETIPPAAFVVCRFCSARFMPGPHVACPQCGAPL